MNITTNHFHAHTYIAGNIRNYLAQWKALTQDQWIHQVVEGYQIEFSSAPPVDNACPMYKMDKPRLEALDQEILDLLNKGAVENVESGELGFASPMFVVPKKGGKWRPIINLKFLNQFVEKLHFKMEDIKNLKDILQEGDQMAKLDLKDAYFSISIAEKHRKFLQFYWRNQLLQFTCLPFGLSSAPYVFTKLLRPVLTFLRDKGIRCLMYLDDMLILGRTATELNHNFALVKPLLTSLGFLVNEDKSVPGPTQELEFLGFLINSKRMTLAVTDEKIKSLISQCKTLMESPQITIRQLARIIGVMTSMTPAVLPAPLHYQALQELKNTALDHHHSYFAQITLTQEAKQDLMWWRTYLRQWKSRSILPKRAFLTLESDASDLGWGAVSLNQKTSTGGVWNTHETTLHINCKELFAAWLGLQCYASTLQDVHIHLRIDNTAAVAYVNKMGGLHSKNLCQLALQVWDWCLSRNLTISAEHLPGSLNQLADKESRTDSDSSEWALDTQIFHRLMEMRGPCTVDLFASRLSAKLPTYFSWRTDPGAKAVDALTQSWNNIRGYAFPPFCLIGRCLAKIRSEKVPWVLLITPLWKSQTWFPLLPEMSVEPPIVLPSDSYLLTDPHGSPHPMILQGHLQLVAWTVSGTPCKVEAFQTRLSHSCVHHGGATQNLLTPVRGERWCLSEGVNPLCATIENVLEFLTDQFHQGEKYSTLNIYRSAISTTHTPVDGFQVGKHPLVSRLMKGAFIFALLNQDMLVGGT